MKTLIHFLFSFCYLALASTTDRPCGSNYSNIWLELIFVVDNSQGMGSTQLGAISAAIETILDGMQIGIQDDNPRTTRVGIITYSRNATIVANLDTFHSFLDFLNKWAMYSPEVSPVDESNMSTGLELSEKVFEDGKRYDRSTVRKIIVVFASAYNAEGEFDPVPIANRLKSNGVSIVAVGISPEKNIQLLHDLSKVASPEFVVENSFDSFFYTQIEKAFLQTNCFCPNGWTQYRDEYGDNGSIKYGTCLKAVAKWTNWMGARTVCHAIWPNGYLVNEFSQQKHDYVLTVVGNTNTFSRPYKYHIGLSSNNGNWYWDQPTGSDPIPLASTPYSNWNPDFPILDSSKQSVINNESASSDTVSTSWQNIDKSNEGLFFVCEVDVCDTDNYCDYIGD